MKNSPLCYGSSSCSSGNRVGKGQVEVVSEDAPLWIVGLKVLRVPPAIICNSVGLVTYLSVSMTLS